jgi:glycosyltransferase involved in cell wall biosynthesis
MLFAPAGVFTSPAHISANSNFTRKRLLENYSRVDPKRVSVAYLGVSDEWFEPGDAARLPAGVRPVPDRHLVVSVGRLTPRKGQLTLVRAIAGLTPAERARLTLVLVGSEAQRDRSYSEELLRAANEAKPAEIVLTGLLEDVEIRALFSVADVFCIPGSNDTSAIEGFGLAFLEAAAQGLAAVAGAVGGVPEVVVHGETGILVPPNDPQVFGTALAGLLRDRDYREKLGASALMRARTFTWERCARETFGEV